MEAQEEDSAYSTNVGQSSKQPSIAVIGIRSSPCEVERFLGFNVGLFSKRASFAASGEGGE
jgi:hypothetical protein